MGNLNNIPKLRFPEFSGEWEKKKLREVFSIFNGYAFPSNESAEDGVLWVKIADVGIQEMKKKNLSFLPSSFKDKYSKFTLFEGDYVVALTRPILNGKLKIAQIDNFFNGSLLNQRVGKIETKNSKGFVYCYLQKDDLIKSIENNIAGSDPPNLSPTEINNIELVVPAFPEQNKIAAFFSVVDEKLQSQKKKKSLLEEYKKGVMQKIFSQELRFKDENGEEFPEWEEKTLGGITNIRSGLSKDQNGNIEGYKVTRIETISDGTINLNKIGFIDIVDKIDDYKLQKGDILFSNINSVSHIGKTAIAYSDLDLYHGMNLLCLRSMSSTNPLFLFYYFNTVELRNHFKTICNQAVSQASINQTELAKTELALPSLPEQTKIANFLSAIDEKINRCGVQIEKMEAWKKGLLQKMFV